MASARYLRNIQPEQPEEPPKEMTRKQKLENFWFYYKWHMIIGAFVAVLVVSFVYEMATQVRPDYQIAVLSATALPEDTVIALETQLAALTDDRNADGKNKVTVLQYTVAADGGDTPNPSDPYTQMAGVTKLMADAQSGDSILFLTDDVATFQQAHELFAYNDGTMPGEGETPDLTRMGVKWTDCPRLMALELGTATLFDGTTYDIQDTLQDFVLVSRVFEGTAIAEKEEKAAYYKDSMRLYATLTEGAR